MCHFTASFVRNVPQTTKLHIVSSNASSHREADDYCASEFGGSLIDNDDVSLLYDDANLHLWADGVIGDDDEVKLFWTKEHVGYTGEFEFRARWVRFFP